MDSIEGCVVHSAVEPVGSFGCSNPLINHIHRNILWGQVNNLMSVPTDCPQRDERMGWMGDAQLTAEEAMFNFNMAGFYTKYCGDMREARLEDGSVPDIVPPFWSLYPADPAWGTACVTVPWYLYLFYGDRRILEQNYEMMSGWVDFLAGKTREGILHLGKFGDWCQPLHVVSSDTPIEVTSTWYLCHDAALVNRIARILGKDDDAARFLELAEDIKTAFNKRFLQIGWYSGETLEQLLARAGSLVPEPASPEQKLQMVKNMAGLFAPPSQTANTLPLFLDMVPRDKRQGVIEALLKDIRETRATHLNTGIVGTRYIFDVLTEIGQAELAYSLATQTTFPSWGYMIREGATTIWERWEYLDHGGMNSHNHIMLGTVDAWFHKVIAGIVPDPDGPGFERVTIKPYPVGDLASASASLATVRGLLSSSWHKAGQTFTLDVTIPANSRAQVHLPKLGTEHVVVEEGGHSLWADGAYVGGVPGVLGGTDAGDRLVFDVGSGSYELELRAAD